MNYCFVDYRISPEEEQNLSKLNIDIIKVPPSNTLYEAIDGHPDIQINIINQYTILVQKDMDKNFLDKLNNLGVNYILSAESLAPTYPGDISLNAVNLEDIFIHNLKYTDKKLFDQIKDKETINVTQGYTKCSCAIVSENAFMTSDKKIYDALSSKGFDVLILPPGDIILPGLDYGFIGGTCGLLPDKKLVFYGDLKNYKYGDLVLNFLKKHNVSPIFLSNGPLIDRGSILFLSI